MDPVSAESGGNATIWSASFPSVRGNSGGNVLSVGPYFGTSLINDAVTTSLITLKAVSEIGIGQKVDSFA